MDRAAPVNVHCLGISFALNLADGQHQAIRLRSAKRGSEPVFLCRSHVGCERPIGGPQCTPLFAHDLSPTLATSRRHRVFAWGEGHPVRELSEIWLGPGVRKASFRTVGRRADTDRRGVGVMPQAMGVTRGRLH